MNKRQRSRLPILGVDPGKDGAAALLAPGARSCWAWWVWQEMAPPKGSTEKWWRVKSCNCSLSGFEPNDEEDLVHKLSISVAGVVGDYSAAVAVQMVLEGLFVAKGQKQSVSSVLPLAEQCGLFRAAFASQVPVMRPTANVWRPKVGVRGDGTAGSAEKSAIFAVQQGYIAQMPQMDWSELTKAETGALAEAVCMARYGYVVRKYHPYWQER